MKDKKMNWLKWNKPDRERQIPCDISLICGILIKKIKLIETENRKPVARGLDGGRNKRVQTFGYKMS